MPAGQPSGKKQTMAKALLKTLGLCFVLSGSVSVNASENSRQASINPAPRIVGGSETSISQVPATVALLHKFRVEIDGDLFQAQFCGGTVISARWVLTAAHCVIDLQGGETAPPENILILTGSTSLENPVNQPIAVVRIIAHPDYRRVEQGDDIALLELEYDAQIQPVALNNLPIGLNDEAFIAGWGAVNTQEDGRIQNYPKELRGAFVNMTPGTDCGGIFPDYLGFTDETSLCAGVPSGGRDSCQGDSGGPLYRVNSDDNSITSIAGITSWGISCGVATNPGVYTNVGAYTGWIAENTGVSAPTQPVNDGVPVQQLQQPLVPASSSQEPVAVAGGNEDHVFGGALWAGLLPLLALLFGRKGLTFAYRLVRR